MSRVWVQVQERKKYFNGDSGRSGWKLGTIVGERIARRYKDRLLVSDLIQGTTFWQERRYLVEVEGGVVVEAWESETYKEAPEASSSGDGLEVSGGPMPPNFEDPQS